MNAFLTYRLIACLALFCCLIACGQEEEESSPATDILATHTLTAFAAEKVTGWQTAPAAPQAPTDGTPFVKSVSYYADWRRTQALTEPVAPGTTIVASSDASEEPASTPASGAPEAPPPPEPANEGENPGDGGHDWF